MNLKYVGKSVTQKDIDAKIKGKFKYIDDLKIGNIYYVKLVFSNIARGRIKKICLERAREIDGVKKIYTYQNTPQTKFNGYCWYEGQNVVTDEVLLTPYVRYYGDRVAAVVAEDKTAAEKAADLIEIEYEEEEPILDPEEVLNSHDSLHDSGNPFAERDFAYGDVDRVFRETEDNYIIEDKIETPRIHHAALEPHNCLALPAGSDKITIISPCQLLFSVRLITARILDLPLNKVQVIKANMGGSFGGKQETFLEPLAAYIAHDLKVPVKIQFNREETIISTRTRNKVIGEVKTAVDKEGKLLARDIDLIVDTGAYTSNGDIVSAAMAKKISRLYRIDNQRYHSYSVHTTTPVGGACRGYGSPQIHTLIETNIDSIARALDIDRVEIRMKNLLDPYAEDLLGGPNIGNARIKDALQKGAAEFQWKDRVRKGRGRGRYRYGVGLACATHVNGFYDVYPDFTALNLRMYEDGSILLNGAFHELGAGVKISMAQIVAEVLDISPAEIEVLEGDTDRSPYDIGCHASRTTFVNGRAVLETAEKLKELFINEISELFNINKGKVIMKDGQIIIEGKKYTYGELVKEIQRQNQVEMYVNYSYNSTANPASTGVHFVEVNVDTCTGLVEIGDYVAVHDVGKAINPAAVEGQIHGGVQMGIGMAVCEKIKLDNEGRPVTTNFDRYQLINAPDMPDVRVFLIEEGGDEGPFGAKSIGEIATVPVAAAVINAINDALDIKIDKLPATPARIIEEISRLSYR